MYLKIGALLCVKTMDRLVSTYATMWDSKKGRVAKISIWTKGDGLNPMGQTDRPLPTHTPHTHTPQREPLI